MHLPCALRSDSEDYEPADDIHDSMRKGYKTNSRGLPNSRDRLAVRSDS